MHQAYALLLTKSLSNFNFVDYLHDRLQERATEGIAPPKQKRLAQHAAFVLHPTLQNAHYRPVFFTD